MRQDAYDCSARNRLRSAWLRGIQEKLVSTSGSKRLSMRRFQSQYDSSKLGGAPVCVN